MDVLEKLQFAAIIPVVVLDEAKNAVPTAKAMLSGGIDVMEITFRTEAAAESIRAVAEQCPDMLVGAGTVLTLEQCERAVNQGAQFIVSPGFDPEIVSWCVHKHIPVVPGCVTPTEITAARKLGLNVVKFFPANVYGGLSAMKALAAPFGTVKFIPTGGVNENNLGEYISAPFVHAVGGSWICPKADIAAGNFSKITDLCRKARKAALGFEPAHLGINMPDEAAAVELGGVFSDLFGFEMKEGNSSVFSTSAIEIMKSDYLGERGHIAVKTNSIPLAVNELKKKGFSVKEETAKRKNGRITAVYLEREIGGFAVHLLQK